jgi:hypothetical protein
MLKEPEGAYNSLKEHSFKHEGVLTRSEDEQIYGDLECTDFN